MIGGLVAIGRGILGGLSIAGDLLTRAFRSLGWKRAAVLAIVIAAIVLAFIAQGRGAEIERLELELEIQASEHESELELERVAHRITKRDYRAAQAEAERLELERLAQAEKRQKGITDEISQDYDRRLADLRARFERLQNGARARAELAGASRDLAMPGVPDPTGGAHAPPIGGAMARAARGAELEPAERLRAAEQALQLSALIDWIEAQGKAALPE